MFCDQHKPGRSSRSRELHNVRVGGTGLLDDPDLAPHAEVDESARQRPNRQWRTFEVGPARRHSSAGVLQTCGDSVDRQQQQALRAVTFFVVVNAGPQSLEGAQLKVRERVDVRVSQLDRAA